jgi:hypothetical protein
VLCRLGSDRDTDNECHHNERHDGPASGETVRGSHSPLTLTLTFTDRWLRDCDAKLHEFPAHKAIPGILSGIFASVNVFCSHLVPNRTRYGAVGSSIRRQAGNTLSTPHQQFPGRRDSQHG